MRKFRYDTIIKEVSFGGCCCIIILVIVTVSFALYWLVKDESYDASRKIMDNRYNFDTQCIDIHISHYRAVNNFAKKYDFQFSEAAIAAIEQYKEEKRNMRKVKVKDV